MTFDIIVSFEKKTFACGLENGLPWHYPPDLKLFKQRTTYPHDATNILIVGYKTFQSLPRTLKPCNRKFVVVCDTDRGYQIPEEFEPYVIGVVKTFRDAYRISRKNADTIYVIGGSSVYQDALNHKACRYIYAGIFDLDKVVYDTIFPLICMEDMVKIETVYEREDILLNETKGTYEMNKYILRQQ